MSQVPGGGRDVAALTADNNRLVSLNGIHSFASLIQVSVLRIQVDGTYESTMYKNPHHIPCGE